MSDELVQRVLHVIADAQRLPPEKVTIDSTLEELGIDSMDGVSLLFALENEFDINIPDEVAKNIRTVREMVAGVAGIVEPTDPPTNSAPPTHPPIPTNSPPPSSPASTNPPSPTHLPPPTEPRP